MLRQFATIVLVYALAVSSAQSETVLLRRSAGPGIDSAADFDRINALARTLMHGDIETEDFAAYFYLIVTERADTRTKKQIFTSIGCMFGNVTEYTRQFPPEELALLIVPVSSVDDLANWGAQSTPPDLANAYDYAYADKIMRQYIIPHFETARGQNGILFQFNKALDIERFDPEFSFWLPFQDSAAFARYIFNDLERYSSRDRFSIRYDSLGWRYWSRLKDTLADVGASVGGLRPRPEIGNEEC